jgi:hypothetical protein
MGRDGPVLVFATHYEAERVGCWRTSKQLRAIVCVAYFIADEMDGAWSSASGNL